MDTALMLRIASEKNQHLENTEISSLLSESVLVRKLTTDFVDHPLGAVFRIMGLSEIPHIERLPYTQKIIDYINRNIATKQGFSCLGGIEEIVPCYNAMLLEAYCRLGLAESKEAQAALSWIEQYQLFERNQTTSWPHKGVCKHGGCLGKTPCYIGIGKTVRALTIYSECVKHENQNVEKLLIQGTGYKQAVATLANGQLTTLVLVSRPESSPLKEAERASSELAALGVDNQLLIVNGVLSSFDDSISESLYAKQQKALADMPAGLKDIAAYFVPLRAYNITGMENVRNLLQKDSLTMSGDTLNTTDIPTLRKVIDDLDASGKKVIFTMGKGGVGKTTIAAAIALGLSAKGKKVHLTTTDPAAHLKFVMDEASGITMSHIDEKEELRRYQEEVLKKARETMSEDDVAYVEEDLRSPCTQEIAVFRAFAEIVDRAENEVVVIDTAPTGHTLLLLDSTQSYHREVKRTQGDIPEAVKKLLPRLRNADETAVIIVTLAETTPVFEAMRLEEDLKRAEIATRWWVINSSLYATETSNELLKAKASHEVEWINKVDELSHGCFAVIRWSAEDIRGEKLLTL